MSYCCILSPPTCVWAATLSCVGKYRSSKRCDVMEWYVTQDRFDSEVMRIAREFGMRIVVTDDDGNVRSRVSL